MVYPFMNVHGLCLHSASCVYVQGVSFSTFVHFFCGGTPDCSASDHSGTGMKKNADAGTSPVRQETQFGTGILRYPTEMLNAGMTMPAASACML
jgi:hypothetical protein